MNYSLATIQTAFHIYAVMAACGYIAKLDSTPFFEDDTVRSLVENYAAEVQCTITNDAENLYLIPIAASSPFHISNESLKKEYLRSGAVNLDIYLMYLAVIVLFGCFYDSYTTTEPVDFVPMQRWLEEMNSRLDALSRLGEDVLSRAEQDLSVNWLALIRKWSDMDSIKETAKRQDGRTNSRVSFLTMTASFLMSQHLLHDQGDGQFTLTDKARTIIVTYYMSEDYNQGILNFMYQLDHIQPKEQT